MKSKAALRYDSESDDDDILDMDVFGTLKRKVTEIWSQETKNSKISPPEKKKRSGEDNASSGKEKESLADRFARAAKERQKKQEEEDQKRKEESDKILAECTRKDLCWAKCALGENFYWPSVIHKSHKTLRAKDLTYLLAQQLWPPKDNVVISRIAFPSKESGWVIDSVPFESIVRVVDAKPTSEKWAKFANYVHDGIKKKKNTKFFRLKKHFKLFDEAVTTLNELFSILQKKEKEEEDSINERELIDQTDEDIGECDDEDTPLPSSQGSSSWDDTALEDEDLRPGDLVEYNDISRPTYDRLQRGKVVMIQDSTTTPVCVSGGMWLENDAMIRRVFDGKSKSSLTETKTSHCWRTVTSFTLHRGKDLESQKEILQEKKMFDKMKSKLEKKVGMSGAFQASQSIKNTERPAKVSNSLLE